jgi:hypothetical protein
MKVNQAPVKAFKPITLTIESEGELAFLVRIFGATYPAVNEHFNIDTGEQLSTYRHLLSFMDEGVIDSDSYPILNIDIQI